MSGKALILIKDSFGYFLACMGLDVLFFIAVGFLTKSIVLKMQESLLQIAAVFSAGLSELSRSGSVLDVLFSSSALPFWKSWFLHWLLFMLVIYLVYIVVQSVAWNLSLRIIGKNISFLKYFVSFALLNLFWFLLFIVYNIIDLTGDLRSSMSSGATISLFSVFAGILLIFLAYFAVISYVRLSLKKSFIFGCKRYRELVPPYFFVLLYFFILNFVLSKIVLTSYAFAVVAGIVLFVPAIAFARVYLALNINKVK